MPTISEELNENVAAVESKRQLALAYHASLAGDFRIFRNFVDTNGSALVSLDEVLNKSPLDALLLQECVARAGRFARSSEEASSGLRSLARALAKRYRVVLKDAPFLQSRAQELMAPALCEILVHGGDEYSFAIIDEMYEADARHAYADLQPRRGTTGVMLTLAVAEGKPELVSHLLSKWPKLCINAAGRAMPSAEPTAVMSNLLARSVRSRAANASFDGLCGFIESDSARALGIAPLDMSECRNLLADACTEEMFERLLDIDMFAVGSNEPCGPLAETPYLIALRRGFFRASERLRRSALAGDELMSLIRLSKDDTITRDALREAMEVSGVDVDRLASDGERPIVLAARYARLDLVRVLLESGADPHLADGSGRTAMRSCPAAHKEELRALLGALAARTALRSRIGAAMTTPS